MTLPAVAALQSAAGGVRPPAVWIRWMNVVSTRRSPPRPGVVFVERSTQSMAVRSTLTLFTTVPTAWLPSFACHVGPRKWVTTSLPLSAYRFARGTAELHVAPLHV